jgi:uncharacterized membrane protein
MARVLLRDVRVGDAALIANLERNVSFLASTTILILAGLLTVFTVSEQVSSLVSQIPFAINASALSVQLKVVMLVVIFVYAFFTFTWSMRQYGFVNVMMGAAPIDVSGQNENLKSYAKQMATVQDQAAHSYNYGLRSYYFALAAMCWFFHPILFILMSMWVVYTLYTREFHSKSVKAITEGQRLLKLERETKLESKGKG